MKIEIYIVDLCWKSEKKIWVLIILSLEEKYKVKNQKRNERQFEPGRSLLNIQDKDFISKCQNFYISHEPFLKETT